MKSAPPAVQIEELRHRFGERKALDGVSLDVERGRVVGLLGPNGGGKTTLFRILATLLRPGSGRAAICGDSVLEAPAAVRRRLGVVFQRPGLDLKLTVLENLSCHGRLHGLSGGDLRGRCRESLAVLGLSDRAGDRTERLSGGLQRRAELAKCLITRPEVLLLDEPGTGIDPGARRDFSRLLSGLASGQGTTVLLTTHFMEEAERCDQVGILHEGRLVAFGEPRRLTERIGAGVVTLHCLDPSRLRPVLAARLGVEPALVDGTLRLEVAEGHRLIGRLGEEFAGEITQMTWGQPTLEDLFIRLTGRRFEQPPGGAPAERAH